MECASASASTGAELDALSIDSRTGPGSYELGGAAKFAPPPFPRPGRRHPDQWLVSNVGLVLDKLG